MQENSPYRYFIRERAKTIRERKTPEVLYYSFPAVACRALLTGDLEGSGEEEVLGAAERCQILKVAHHGSKNSTSEAFLNRIQPQISLISCAWPGRYGHPHRELLERLRACKSHIYGTPVDGAVTVQLKRDRLAVHGYRADVEFPVS